VKFNHTIKFSAYAYLKLQDHKRNNQAYLQMKRLGIHLTEMSYWALGFTEMFMHPLD